MRLIDADALPRHGGRGGIVYWKDIELAPAIIFGKQGRWIEREVTVEKCIEEWQSARCSVCGKYHTTPYMYYFYNSNYCPNCGARMESEEDD